MQSHQQGCALGQLHCPRHARHCLVIAPEIGEPDRRHPEMNLRVRVHRQGSLVRGECGGGVGTGIPCTGYPITATSRMNNDSGSSDGLPSSRRGDFQIAEHPIQERDVGMGQRLTWVERERAIEVVLLRANQAADTA